MNYRYHCSYFILSIFYKNLVCIAIFNWSIWALLTFSLSLNRVIFTFCDEKKSTLILFKFLKLFFLSKDFYFFIHFLYYFPNNWPSSYLSQIFSNINGSIPVAISSTVKADHHLCYYFFVVFELLRSIF